MMISRNALFSALALAATMAASGCSRAPMSSTARAASEGLVFIELPDLPGCETFAQSAPKGTVEVTPLRDYAELYFVADGSGGRCIDTLDGLTTALALFPDAVPIYRGAAFVHPGLGGEHSSDPMPGTDPDGSDPMPGTPTPGTDPKATSVTASDPMPGKDRR